MLLRDDIVSILFQFLKVTNRSAADCRLTQQGFMSFQYSSFHSFSIRWDDGSLHVYEVGGFWSILMDFHPRKDARRCSNVTSRRIHRYSYRCSHAVPLIPWSHMFHVEQDWEFVEQLYLTPVGRPKANEPHGKVSKSVSSQIRISLIVIDSIRQI